MTFKAFGLELTIRVQGEGKEGKGGRPGKLPDNSHFTNRFAIKSESSDRLYIIGQSISGRWWGCSCRGWISHKHCKHLSTLQLPGSYIPCEAKITGGR